MQYEQRIIKLTDIAHDNTFRITFQNDLASIIDSIINVGLINSPIVKLKDNKYVVISGFRRIDALTELNYKEILLRVLDPSLTLLDCALIAITENVSDRELNLIELARAYALLQQLLPDFDHVIRYAEKLGLSHNIDQINKILTLNAMSKEIWYGIVNNQVAFPVALELYQFDDDIIHKFVKLFCTYKMSLNKQREILSLIKEIAIREDLSLVDVFKKIEGQGFWVIPLKDSNAVVQKIRTFLKQWRYPNIEKKINQYNSCIKEMKLPGWMSLMPPKDFEGTNYLLTLKFKDYQEIQQHLDKVNEVITNPKFYELFH